MIEQYLDTAIGGTLKLIAYIFGITIGIILSADVYFGFMILVIFVDSFFGVLALKDLRKEFNWSRLFFRGMILKSVVYGQLILIVWKIDQIFIKEIWETKLPLIIMMAMIFSSEIKSIFKNYSKWKGNDFSNDYDFLMKLLDRLRKAIDAIKGNDLKEK